MKNFVKNRKQWLGMLLILFMCIILVNPGYAASNNKGRIDQNQGIEITYPEKNSTVSGYFIPVSWRDSEVESTKISYPENYQQSNSTYQVTVLDKEQNIMLKATVENQNYFVFHYDEFRNFLNSDTYFVTVEKTDTMVSSRSLRFFYEGPVEEAAATSDTQTATSETLAQEETLSLSSTASTTSSSPCEYCLRDNWPGMLVILMNPSTYTKYTQIICNQLVWSSLSFDPNYTGPVFISIGAGNYKMTYYDSIYYSVRCIDIYPWAYTVVYFP